MDGEQPKLGSLEGARIIIDKALQMEREIKQGKRSRPKWLWVLARDVPECDCGQCWIFCCVCHTGGWA